MFGSDVENAAIEHARKDNPLESCGFVVNGEYMPRNNISADPQNHFVISPQAWAAASKIGEIQAIIHSHTGNNGPYPSAADMKMQMNCGLPCGIVTLTKGGRVTWFGDHILDEPLVGRDFIPGVKDCYAIIRAFYWQEYKIKLIDFARDAEWWAEGKTLFVDGFQKAGFYAINKEQLRPGDVILMQIRSKTPNHGAVVLENGLMLHHVYGQLSRREPFGRWLPYATHFLRYKHA